jgi:cation transport ATPase
MAVSLSSHSIQIPKTSIQSLQAKKWQKKYVPLQKKKSQAGRDWLYVSIVILFAFFVWGLVLGIIFLGLAWYWWVLGSILGIGMGIFFLNLFWSTYKHAFTTAGIATFLGIAGALFYFLSKSALLQMIGLGIWAFTGMGAVLAFLTILCTFILFMYST